MKNLQILIVILSALFLASCEKEKPDPNEKPDITGQTGTLTDIDGNTYNWIGIGGQAWMAENLKAIHYADGSAIPLVEDNTAWDNLENDEKAYCWFLNNASNGEIYGALYTWAAAMNGAASSDANPSGVQGVCPDGWHMPTDDEWKELAAYFGTVLAGGKLKETGTTHWFDPNTGATNSSGFTALPGGNRTHVGRFQEKGASAMFWTATEYSSSYAYRRDLSYEHAQVNREYLSKSRGQSVRCVRD